MIRFRKTYKPLYLSLLAIAGSVALHAQTSALTVSPTQLTFNVQNGAISSQNLVVFSNSGSANFSATATSGGNWLTVSPVSGTTPQVLLVSANGASLNTGTYGGFVTISSGSNTNVVPVILNVNTSGSSVLTANPGTLTFSFPTTSSIPQSQAVAIGSSNGVATSFTATPATNNGGNWLSVSPNAATSPANLLINVNPSGLTAGVYFGSVALNPPGTTGVVIPVQVNVAAASTLTVAPQRLSFAYQTGTTNPAAQTLTLTTAGGATVPFTATAATTSCGSNWLVVSPQASASPGVLTVQINPTGLQPGNCQGTINISAPTATNPTQSIPVDLLVSNNPLLQVPATGPVFNYQLGTATPASQTIQVTSSSSPLNFTVSTTPVSGGPDFLTVSPATGITPQGVTLTVNPTVLAGLAPNTYAQNVTITSAAAGNPAQTFTVTLNVSNTPTLIATQQAVNFNYQIGQTTPANQTITLSSNGAPLTYTATATATTCPGFLTVTPASGTTQFQPGQPSQIVVGVNPSSVTTPQTCTGLVTLTVPGSTAAPLILPVTLTASSTPLINVSPAALSFIAIPGAASIQQTISLTSTDLATALPFTATAATVPAGLTWLSVTPNVGTTPASLNVTINAANLAPGVYMGSINVTSSSPNVPPQTIPVMLTVATGGAIATPGTLTFNQPVGGGNPSAQTIQITGVPAGTTIGATTTLFNGTSWLTTTTSGNTVTVTPNGTQLQQGTYSGVVTIFVPGAAVSPIYVPVTYTVGGASTFTVTPSNVSFNYQVGASVPPAQTVQLSSGLGAIAFNATVVAPPGTGGGVVFVTASPTSGTTPGAVTFTLNQSVISTLAAGIYTNTVNLTSPSAPGTTQSFNVTLNVTAAGPPTVSGIVHGATFLAGPVAPGELVSIFGSNIGPAQGTSLTVVNGKVSTTLANVQVTFNGVPAPITYAQSNQLNVVVPYEVAGATSATVVVMNGTATSAPFQVAVANTAPGIFTLTQNGGGQGAILNQDGTVNGGNAAAARGTGIAIYATGGGQLSPAGTTGLVQPSTGTSFPLNAAPVTATIGGVPVQVLYAGAAPSLVSGVMQINVLVGQDVPTGVQPLVLMTGGVSSPSVATVVIR